MELRDDVLEVDRERSALDDAVLSFTDILDESDVKYVIVSGYVAILTGRSRSTEAVDIVIERLAESAVEALTGTLADRGYWGLAEPLDSLYEMLDRDGRVRIAEEDTVFPNFECWFVSNEVERAALTNSLSARFNGDSIQISPIELQIAYKLWLTQQMDTTQGKDFEDALHLYLTFTDDLTEDRLETYVNDLDVEEYYRELRTV